MTNAGHPVRAELLKGAQAVHFFSFQPRTGPSLPVNKILRAYLQRPQRAGLWSGTVDAKSTLSEGAPGLAQSAPYPGGQELSGHAGEGNDEACGGSEPDAQEGGFEEKNVKNPAIGLARGSAEKSCHMRTKTKTIIVLRKVLKKASAVTLAAVMAVTFAPVASLNAFAANVGVITVGSKNVITGGGATITDDGTYVLTPGGVNTTPIEVTGSATQVTIDLNGVTSAAVKIAGTAKGVKNIKIVNNGYNEQKAVEATNYPVIPEVKLTGVDTAASISFSGYMIADGDGDILKYAGSNAAAATGAAVNTHLYIGQLAIDDLARKDGTGADVYAMNGAVNVKELRDTRVAVLSPEANVGTTLTATAVKGKSLTKAETTYNYTFYSKELNGYGTSSYTDVRYAAGASSFGKAFDTTGFATTDTPNPTVTGVGLVSGASINTKYLSSKVTGDGFGIVKFRYSRALTLTQDDNDKWEKMLSFLMLIRRLTNLPMTMRSM